MRLERFLISNGGLDISHDHLWAIASTPIRFTHDHCIDEREEWIIGMPISPLREIGQASVALIFILAAAFNMRNAYLDSFVVGSLVHLQHNRSLLCVRFMDGMVQ
jgi:hypothetical protein